MDRGRSNNGLEYQAIQIDKIEEVIHPAAENETARSAVGSIGEDRLNLETKSERSIPLAGQVGARTGSLDEAAESCSAYFLRRLEQEVRSVQAQASPCTIFSFPPSLDQIDRKAAEPEIVSIGPYHRGKKHLLEFEEHKWWFFKRFLHRTKLDVETLIELVTNEESRAKHCYSEAGKTQGSEFIKMMLLDGCFVVELLLHISNIYRRRNQIEEGDPIHSRPSIIHILTRDLLKLENQVPYFLLQSLFDLSSSTKFEAMTPHLCMLALRVFNPYMLALRVFNRSKEYTDLQYMNYSKIKCREYDHLLDLFHFTLSLTNSVQGNPEQQSDQQYRPSPQSIPCVTQLRPSGIEFKPNKTVGFLDISFRKRKSFRKRVLEIPYIAFDDFMITVLINCIALEQRQEKSSKHVTDYVSFMLCLINQPKDVSLLCSDGIISTLSRDDQYVVDLFNKLGKSIVFNVCNCSLSKQFEDLGSYYQSNRASMIRNYFSSPRSAISVFTASLILALTIIQTVFAVLK